MTWTSDYGAQRDYVKGVGVSGPKGLEPNYYSILFTRTHMRARASKGEVWQKIHSKPSILPDQLYILYKIQCNNFRKEMVPKFNIFRIVYLHIILLGNQIDAQFLL
jgi:hypothetical protein